jgi:uncharacterized protein YfcZ (UPF0381/DUF406 family)
MTRTTSRSDCVAEAARVFALALQERDELAATEGVAAAARAAGCRSEREIAAYRDAFFPGAPLALEQAS